MLLVIFWEGLKLCSGKACIIDGKAVAVSGKEGDLMKYCDLMKDGDLKK